MNDVLHAEIARLHEEIAKLKGFIALRDTRIKQLEEFVIELRKQAAAALGVE